MPQTLTPAQIAAIWPALEALPLDDNNEPLEAAQIREALQRLLDSVHLVNDRVVLDVQVPRQPQTDANGVAVLAILSCQSPLRLHRGTWDIPAGYTLEVGFIGTQTFRPVDIPPSQTPYVTGADRSSFLPINHALGGPFSGGPLAVVLVGPALATLPALNVHLEFELV
ncbi:MAG: hypothetical protein SFU83_23690 [Meiothermus sp.]|nr:hypothetical protein [Meiothermus sp.]